mgnify:CR=1 FL=1|tara:strand:+ start:2789 stop:4261 length:1473 start_codon:yes stop_codon:yes gene_type:complete
MAIPFLSDIKLNGNQIKELVVDHKSGSQPSTGFHGQLIFRTDLNKIYINESTDQTSPSWASIAGDITSVTAGNGLTGDATTGDVTLAVGVSKGIAVGADKILVDADDVSLNFTNNSDSAKLQLKEIDNNRILGNVSGDSEVPTALTKSDVLTMINVADGAQVNVGTNLTVTENNTTVSIASSTGSNDSIAAATTSKAGVMTKDDKSKLDGIATSANNYSLDLSKLDTVTSAMDENDTLTFGDSDNDTQVTIKGNLTVIGTTTTNNVETVSTSSGVIFEGSSADGHDATLTSVVASSDKTYTLPNITGHIPILTNDPGTTAISATVTELNYVDGVTSAIQTQIDGKQDTITGAATTIDDSDLTASRALVSNASGKVAVSAVTSTEVGYLDGVTSGIQTQLDAKENADNKITEKLSGSSSTSYTITHNHNSPIVATTVLDYGNDGVGATYEQVMVDIQKGSDNNTITITFGTAPGTSQDYLVLMEKFPAVGS